MAHVQFTSPHPDHAVELLIDGVDFSRAVFRDGVELVSVGDNPATAEIGLRITIAVGRLDINGETVELSNNFGEAAAQVAAIVADDEAVSA